jgi:type II restriction enzyme
MQSDQMGKVIEAWKMTPHGSYLTWFLWEERLKNFRSIRTGVRQVIEEIEQGRFGNSYRGSSLETVVHSIAEQKQIFKGADHAFLWKPKMRIPDIYENEVNKRAFAKFLGGCLECCGGHELVEEIIKLDAVKIKGLGPAAANLLYFMHPTLVPPFNTAIVKGYNKLMGAKVKLGRWDEYLAMREGMLRFGEKYKNLLSNDFGALAGFLFDIGSEKISLPEASVSIEQWEADLKRIRELSAESSAKPKEKDESTHADIQGILRDLGKQLGFNVWIAANDRNRVYLTGKLSDGCVTDLEIEGSQEVNTDAIRLIDILWLDSSSRKIVAAFEVEHSTSIYSGILRMLDLAMGPSGNSVKGIYLVAPDKRENEIRAQIIRPSFKAIGDLQLRYLPYGELLRNKEAMGRFGQGLKAIEAVSKAM